MSKRKIMLQQQKEYYDEARKDEQDVMEIELLQTKWLHFNFFLLIFVLNEIAEQKINTKNWSIRIDIEKIAH